ncbi:MAG: polyphosphate kinase 1 [Roseofilum sp. SBFL]|uniref:polyphosphate kinase 1 n=1 Tax=unclassified Roseofilum TaxID=2620099 RepID=UPI001B1F64B4|nr:MULTISPECIES: polyphosphate kinase 1 [unclassified Roseofilum]MBP0013089.1 polyphosphate kinase 1 [Roseofilum sp. SID3]MBP0023743.1 polyphosphate kinase 1 [Roseofilum sp. SID2]MBP0036815.1 polyphosphate kinase 1 [Roseofilum sp. SID1]MBP0042605.1 polyphosphate kinase 1 [Roseofilum sp. SBFL]
MAKSKKTTSPLNLKDAQYYLNRELSWLEFNKRVLHEALDLRTPLLEQLKFLAIVSSNLDEFFMVRIAGLKKQVEAEVHKLTPDGRTPEQQLLEISQQLHPTVEKQHQHFHQVLKPKLIEEGIYLVDYIDLTPDQRLYYQNYFEKQIFPVLTPLAVDPSHPFPYISNRSLNLAVLVNDPKTDEDHFARVKVPRALARFLALPPELYHSSEDPAKIRWMGVPLEQIIAHNLDPLFPGMNIQEYYPFRITRNADLSVQEDEADDLLLAMEQELRKRRIGGLIVRMEIMVNTPPKIRERLIQEMSLKEEDVYEVEGLVGLGDLMSFMGLPLPHLKDPEWSPIVPHYFQGLRSLQTDPFSEDQEEGISIFELIRERDLFFHHPYDSFASTVQRFITEAAYDPKVLAIKMTLYRTSGDSPIVKALIAAAENGKQVVALVELKARFDEENNIQWARTLESAGVHVVYGLVGLKTHTKVVMVVRRDSDQMRRYVHVGTGNYNPKTAKLYTDLGILSCHDELGADLTDLFNFLTGYSRQRSYRKLLVAPVSLRSRMMELIEREIEHARNGHHARIVAKMNSLVDPKMIAALYEASQAGVQIDLIVRGMCCLRPGIPGVSETIRVISIVGRFLEHARIFYFHNQGAEESYIGSADWMPRNLDRRVEAVTPIDDPEIQKDVQEILGVMLADNRHAWELQSDGTYLQCQPPENAEPQSSQDIFMKMSEVGRKGDLHTL